MKKLIITLIIILTSLILIGCKNPKGYEKLVNQKECYDLMEQIKQDYLDQIIFPIDESAKISDITISKEYGIYTNSVVLMISWNGFSYTEALRKEIIGGITIHFSNGQGITIYNNGSFYTLQEAFDNSYLSVDSIKSINKVQKMYNSYLYK